MSDPIRQRYQRLEFAQIAIEPHWLCGHGQTPASGSWIKIYLEIEQGLIKRAAFRALGDPATLCAADWVCEQITAGSVEQAQTINADRVMRELDLGRLRMPAALMAVDATMQALSLCLDANQALA